jgi:crotonobetainyl-CoA hydratase
MSNPAFGSAGGDREEAGAPVLVERQGHTLIVTLNRPHARNAVDMKVSRAVGNALDEADHDADIRAVIITGAGDLAFCAGADLKAISNGEAISPREGRARLWGFAGYVRHAISKPTIAAVNGMALGGGTEIALASDLVVAAESAAFGLPEVKRGMCAGAGGVFRLPGQLPRKIAMEMIFTGEPISALRALELGLINRVVPRHEVLQEAMELAEKICRNAPLAVQASKRIAYGIIDGSVPKEDDLWELTAREAAALKLTLDAREGPTAFKEKRQPVWRAE